MPTARRKDSQAGSEQEQKAAIEEALRAADGNVSIAIQKLGMARSYVYRLLAKYDLTAFAAKLREDAGARKLHSGPRAGVVGLGRPSKKSPRRGHIR
jgi:hypothetical protein